MPPSPRPFFSDCVSWCRKAPLEVLEHLKDAGEPISRAAFLAEVPRSRMGAIERELGYDRHLKMEDDYHVQYFREPDSGIPFFIHSAIEYVFARPAEINLLARKLLEPADPALIVLRPALLHGSQEDEDGLDALDRLVDRAIRHEGPFMMVSHEADPPLPASFHGLFERLVCHLQAQGHRAIITSAADTQTADRTVAAFLEATASSEAPVIIAPRADGEDCAPNI